MGKKKSKGRKAIERAAGANVTESELASMREPVEVIMPESPQDTAFFRHNERMAGMERPRMDRSEYDEKLRILEESMGPRNFQDRGRQMMDTMPVKSYMQTYDEMAPEARLAARDAIRERERRQILDQIGNRSVERAARAQSFGASDAGAPSPSPRQPFNRAEFGANLTAEEASQLQYLIQKSKGMR